MARSAKFAIIFCQIRQSPNKGEQADHAVQGGSSLHQIRQSVQQPLQTHRNGGEMTHEHEYWTDGLQ